MICNNVKIQMSKCIFWTLFTVGRNQKDSRIVGKLCGMQGKTNSWVLYKSKLFPEKKNVKWLKMSNIISAPPPPPRSCRYNSGCFPGAECRDTAAGPQCLRCPSGYHGDGRNCRRLPNCSDHPCFEGVECMDTTTGFVWVLFIIILCAKMKSQTLCLSLYIVQKIFTSILYSNPKCRFQFSLITR